MNRSARRSIGCRPALLLVLAAFGAQAQSGASEGEFLYHTQNGDTLIGLGRRLLRDPPRWHDLQVRNHIAAPRRIPLGTVIRIPYAWLRLSPETATVSSVAGVAVHDGKPLVSGEALAQGSRIETGVDGSVTLDLADGSVITLQKSSTMQLEEMQRVTGVNAAHDLRLKLDSGRLQTVVKPHHDVGRFEIVTPVAVSAARGTQFRTGFDTAAGGATTETLEGAVAVEGSAAAAAVAVPAGFGTRVEHDSPPMAPVRLLPPPDLTAIPDSNTGQALHVHWQAVKGAEGYRIQLSPDADFHAIASDVLMATGEATLPAPADGKYWLRVRSIDAFKLEGPDAVKPLVQHLLPAAPSLVAPPPAAAVSGPRTSFAWRGAAGDRQYRFQIARDPGFAGLVAEHEVVAKPEAVGAREVAATAGIEIDAMQPGRYLWRVAAVNARGEAGDWSAPQSYTQRADAPTPAAPIITAHELQLRWDAQPGEKYRVQIARDQRFDRPRLDRTLDVPMLSIARPHPGNYYVRVQTIDPDGTAGAFGAARQFEVPVPRWLRILMPILALLPLVAG